MLSWKLDVPTFTLSLLTVNIGLAGMKTDAAGVPVEAQQRALIETALAAGLAAHLSRNWWPVVFPAAYLAFDFVWSTKRGQAPQALASEDPSDYEYADGQAQ